MSFCRLGPTSDIYIYDGESEDGNGYVSGYVCCFCKLKPWLKDGDYIKHDNHVTKTGIEMAQHVQVHITDGHNVEDHVIPNLLVADFDINA